MTNLRPEMRYLSGVLLLGALALVALGWPAAPTASLTAHAPSRPAHTVGAFAALPLRFEENLGQTAGEVRYLSRGPGYTLFLTRQEAVLSLRGGHDSGARKPDALKKRETASGSAPNVLRMKLRGAQRSADLRGEQQQAGVSNYFRGNDPAKWQTGVPNYSRVRHNDVYPGIDLVYYGAQGSLEYDFVVAPGADPRQVELEFSGQKALSVDPQGDLLFAFGNQSLRYEKPVIYQGEGDQRMLIAGRYETRGEGRVGFELTGAYDPRRPLVIDPVLDYSTYLGDTDDEQGLSIAVGSDGSVYVTGPTQSSKFPTTSGSVQPNFGGPEDDAFVAKLNSTGTALVFSTFLGGRDNDRGKGIAVGDDGSVFVVGETESMEFPVTNGAWQTQFGRGKRDAFAARISPNGNQLVYSTYMGSDDEDWANDVAVDKSSQAYIIGGTKSSKFPTSTPVLQREFGGDTDAFIVKLGPDGSAPIFSTFLGGGSNDEGLAITIDPFSTVYVTGYTVSNSFPVTDNAFQRERDSVEEAFVAKIFGQGTALAYSSFFGGNGSDFGNGIAVDGVGDVYVTGFTTSNDLQPKTPPVFQNDYNGGGDAFVIKVTEIGRLRVQRLTYLGTSDEDTANAIVVSDDGSVTVVGHTKSSNFPVTVDAVQSQTGGGDGDAFVATLNPLFRNIVFATYLGGNDRDEARDVARDINGNLYITGLTRSSDFPTTTGVLQTSKSNGDDAFIVKIADTLTATTVSTASYLPGGAVAPNSIASAFGSDLAPSSAAADTTPLPATLLGVRVNVTDSSGFLRTAPLFYVSPGQINFLMPEGTAPGTAIVEVTRNSDPIARGTVAVEPVGPGLFSANASGSGVAAALVIVQSAGGERSTQRVFNPDQFPPNIQPIPVNIGTAADSAVLLLFGTGIRGAGGAGNVTVSVGGEQQQVTYAGDQLEFAGLDQINVQLSPTLAGRGVVDVQLTAGGKTSNVVTIQIQ